ncbi:hypothetical protein DMP14_06130 [Pseudonocardia sp. Ae707_Ps2]
MLNRRKDVLAHNLLRLPVEVWPTEPRNHPGVLDLWVADQGSLTRPIPPWPLLTDGTTDYFTGVPIALDTRANLVTGRLFATNWGVAGMMGSGKSALIITTLAGAILDPLVEIDIYCMAHNADYDPFRPIARTLHVSDDPDDLPTVLHGLATLLSELSQRGRKLSSAGEPKLTRTLAAADPAMRPRVVVIDECQELFLSDIGEQAAELVTKIVAKGRKYGVTLLFATPVPSADSLPRAVAKVLSNRACFAIGDHQGQRRHPRHRETHRRHHRHQPPPRHHQPRRQPRPRRHRHRHDQRVHHPRRTHPLLPHSPRRRRRPAHPDHRTSPRPPPRHRTRHQHGDTTGTTSGPARRPAPRHGRPHPDAHPGSTRTPRRTRPRPLRNLDLRTPHRRTPRRREALQDGGTKQVSTDRIPKPSPTAKQSPTVTNTASGAPL